MLFIDTDIAIDIIHENLSLDVLREAFAEQESIALAAPSTFEIFAGLYNIKYRKKDRVPRKKIELEEQGIAQLMKSMHHVHLDWKAAKKGADFFYQLIREGKEIDPFDCMIAAIVLLQEDGKLLTRNVDHFNRFPDLKIAPLPGNPGFI